jgi:hypothetical protein
MKLKIDMEYCWDYLSDFDRCKLILELINTAPCPENFLEKIKKKLEKLEIDMNDMDKKLYEFNTLTMDKPTKNNRIYPREVVERALARYKKENIDERKAFVSLYSEYWDLNLKDVIGLVHDAYIKDDKLVIKMETLDTPTGKTLLTEDGKFNEALWEVAPFGMGSIEKLKDKYTVQNDFELVGFHMRPSRPIEPPSGMYKTILS